MGGKGKWALLVSIQEQSKSPLSKACSRCPFHLLRAHWPPIAMFSVSFHAQRGHFRSREWEAALRLLMPTKSAFLLTYRAIQSQSSWFVDSHKTKPCAACSRTQRRESTQASLRSWCCRPLGICDSWAQGAPCYQRLCCFLLLSVHSLMCPGISFGTFSNPELRHNYNS